MRTSTNERAGAALDAPGPDRGPGVRGRDSGSAAVITDAGRRNRRLVFAVSTASFFAAIAVWLVRTIATTGSLVYAFDDAYIHLTVADQLARNGTWGVEDGVFQSASSAPGWNLLEAALLLVRVPAVVVPLVLAVAASVWALWTMSRVPLVERFGSVPFAVVTAVALPFSLALVSLTMMGMEHALQVAIAMAALALLGDRVGDDAARARRARWALPLLLLAGTAVRYEVLLVAGGCAVAYLLVQHAGGPDGPPSIVSRLGEVGTWIGAALVPVAVIAAVNLSFGQYPLPDSVIAKSLDTPDLTLLRPILAVVLDRRVAVLTVAAVVVLVVARRHWRSPAAAPLVAAVVVTVGFVTVGPVTLSWLGRYQAMVVALLVLAIAIAVVRLPIERTLAMATLAIVVFLPAVMQVSAYTAATLGSEEINLQHHQAATFLDRWYPGGTVALNDAGVLGYEFDGETVDLMGLTTHDVLVARAEDRYGQDFVEALVDERAIDLAVGYTSWIGRSLPEDWTEVGRWCLDQPSLVVGSECLSFFAAEGEPADRLAEHLESFRGELEPGITLELADRG